MDLPSIPLSYLREFLEISKTLAQTKGMGLKKIKSVFNEKEIKSVEDLFRAIDRLKNREVFSGLRKYLASHFLRYFNR